MLLGVAALGPAASQTYFSASATFNWIDSSSHSKVGYATTPHKFNSGCTSTPPVLDDTLSTLIPIGFTFRFGTTDYTSLYINSNGRLQFGNTTCGAGTQSIGPPQTYTNVYPSSTVNNTMKVFGVDLDHTNLVDKPNYPSAANKTPCTSSATCYVSVATLGTAPTRQFVVTWKNVPEWVNAGNTSGSFDLQVILNEDGSFVYQYGAISHGGTGTAQIGWQLSTTDYQVLAFGAATEPAPNTAIKFFLPRPSAAYYFDEAAWAPGVSNQVADSSTPGGHPGTALGLAQTAASGKVCRAASIPLNTSAGQVDAVRTGVNISTGGLNLQGTGTIAFWYKSSTAWSGGGVVDAQLLDASGAGGEWFYLTRKASGALVFTVKDSTGASRSVTTGANAFAAGTWVHVAVSWDFNGAAGSNQDKLQVFVNGATPTASAFTSSGTVSTGVGQLHAGDNPLGVADSNGSVNSANGLIDELQVYNYVLTRTQVSVAMASTHGCPSYVVDHLEIQYAGTNGLTCAPSTLTLRACANASCSSLFTGGFAGTLTATGTPAISWDGSTGNGGGASFAIPSGSSSVSKSFSIGTAGFVDIGVSGLSPSPTSSTPSCNFGSPSCRFTVANAGFVFDVPDHVSEMPQTVSVSALSSAGGSCAAALVSKTKAVRFACAHANPGTGTMPVRVGGRALNAANSASTACDGTSQTVNLDFDGSGTASVIVQYADAGKLSLSASYTGSGATGDAGLVLNGTDSFIAAPASFVFSGLPASSLLAAGESYPATITAINSINMTTPGFGAEAPASLPSFGWTHTAPTGPGAVVGTATGTLGTFTAGSASTTNLSWTEVGEGRWTISHANYLGSALSINGSTGSLRFVPHHFDVTVTPACSGSFSYAGQPFTVKVVARNKAGAQTSNYDGVSLAPYFARNVTLSDGGSPSLGLGTFSGTLIAQGSFSLGVATTTAPTYSYSVKQTGANTLKVRATDTDGVSSAGAGTEGTTLLRSGRLRLSNGFGSKSSPLGLAVEAQYWTGKSWIKNAQDSCTVIPASAIARFNPLTPTGTVSTAMNNTASAVTIAAGAGTLTLSAASPAAAGSLDVAINLGNGTADQACSSVSRNPSTAAARPWLRSQYGSAGGCGSAWDRDPSARASFGIFSPETRKNLHTRELF